MLFSLCTVITLFCLLRATQIGIASYSIYLVHGLAVTALTFLLPFTSSAAFAPLRLGLVIVLSYGFFLAVEQPAHRIARRLALACSSDTHLARCTSSGDSTTFR